MLHSAHLIDGEAFEVFDIFGPTLQFVTRPDEVSGAPAILRGTIPSGGAALLHSHPDPETFVQLSGELEGLAFDRDDLKWIPIRPGEVFHIPAGARHAFRNRADGPAISIIFTTARLAAFFREVARPLRNGKAPDVTLPDLQHFLATAESYGHWNATLQENAEIGIALPVAHM
jgi:quercetin dioxygenase-like cupin family protein